MLPALVEAVRRHTQAQTGESPFRTAVQGLTLLRSTHERLPVRLVYKPALCVVVQGAKWTIFGNKRFDYGAGSALVVSLEMPALSRVAQASPAEPYLGVVLEFDLAILHEILHGLEAPLGPTGNVGMGVLLTDFDGPLADCVLRFVCLLETPQAIGTLYPVMMRELCYWLLTGRHGAALSRLALANGHARNIIDAVHTLRDNFTKPVRVDDLAAVARMSPSAFHRQFKALTSMTPLQYQKQLRLIAARQMLITGAANAETACFEVGYASPSQFSREYARMFGAPPRRDIAALRAASKPVAPQA